MNRTALNEVYDYLQMIDPQQDPRSARHAASLLRGAIHRLVGEPPENVLWRIRFQLSVGGSFADITVVGPGPFTKQEAEQLERVVSLGLSFAKQDGVEPDDPSVGEEPVS